MAMENIGVELSSSILFTANFEAKRSFLGVPVETWKAQQAPSFASTDPRTPNVLDQ
jgi:hypothetical protein